MSSPPRTRRRDVRMLLFGLLALAPPRSFALQLAVNPFVTAPQHIRKAVLSPEFDAEIVAAQWRSDGIVYVEDFLAPSCFRDLQDLAAAYEMRPETKNSVANGRLGTYVAAHEAFSQTLTSPTIRDALRRITGDPNLVPSDFPVELRRYPIGSSMDWHTDEAMYSEPQIECVFTVLNSSDSETQWKPEGAHHRYDDVIVSRFMLPNSLLMVRAEGPLHRVTPVTSGDRVIAKFVYTTSPYKLPAWYENLDAYHPESSSDDPSTLRL